MKFAITAIAIALANLSPVQSYDDKALVLCPAFNFESTRTIKCRERFPEWTLRSGQCYHLRSSDFDGLEKRLSSIYIPAAPHGIKCALYITPDCELWTKSIKFARSPYLTNPGEKKLAGPAWDEWVTGTKSFLCRW